MSAAECLARRIDALTIAFSVELDREARKMLDARMAIAETVGKCEFSLRGLRCELKATRKKKWVNVRNRDMRASLDLQCAANEGGWNLEVILDAHYLASMSHDHEAGIELARNVARSFGRVKAERLRRFDLCADFRGFDLDDKMWRSWLMPKGGKHIKGYLPKSECGTVSQHGNARRVTGYTICPGNVVVERTYAKTEELGLSGREDKKAIEYAIWQANGWHNDRSIDGLLATPVRDLDPVVRVEFQFRGVVLDELKLREPSRLVAKIDSVWQQMTRWWTRLLIPDETEKRRTRWKTDPRWVVVQAVCFKHKNPEVLKRERHRGGATLEQAWGTMLSSCAARGALAPILIHENEEIAETVMIDNDKAIAMATSAVMDVATTFGMVFATHSLGKGKPQEIAQRLVTQVHATRARFASVLDDDQLTFSWNFDPVPESNPPEFRITAAPPRAAPACGWLEYQERLAIASG